MDDTQQYDGLGVMSHIRNFYASLSRLAQTSADIAEMHCAVDTAYKHNQSKGWPGKDLSPIKPLRAAEVTYKQSPALAHTVVAPHKLSEDTHTNIVSLESDANKPVSIGDTRCTSPNKTTLALSSKDHLRVMDANKPVSIGDTRCTSPNKTTPALSSEDHLRVMGSRLYNSLVSPSPKRDNSGTTVDIPASQTEIAHSEREEPLNRKRRRTSNGSAVEKPTPTRPSVVARKKLNTRKASSTKDASCPSKSFEASSIPTDSRTELLDASDQAVEKNELVSNISIPTTARETSAGVTSVPPQEDKDIAENVSPTMSNTARISTTSITSAAPNKPSTSARQSPSSQKGNAEETSLETDNGRPKLTLARMLEILREEPPNTIRTSTSSIASAAPNKPSTSARKSTSSQKRKAKEASLETSNVGSKVTRAKMPKLRRQETPNTIRTSTSSTASAAPDKPSTSARQSPSSQKGNAEGTSLETDNGRPKLTLAQMLEILRQQG